MREKMPREERSGQAYPGSPCRMGQEEPQASQIVYVSGRVQVYPEEL
ncbi:hypothetical protein DHEL01_v211934 [Diaporthe helianthi]|uniref:Uncharacterized protein n=1 Tax=Diaporthe helianthi TaxID=158607 RepID=A0A2P5HHF3_DIAHE|nr:hypothetical protein DHEL01_v211934 [Diaporthe helianthi]